MKKVYSVIITPPEKGEKYFNVYVPDCDLYTEGKDLSDAIAMARDAIGAWGITREDLKLPIPESKTLKPELEENEISALVDIDFAAYRKKEENRTVRKNCTIPLWLNNAAEAKNINFSAVLQQSLLELVTE